MKSKNLCIMVLTLFFCSIVPLSALAALHAESQTSEDIAHGKPWVNLRGFSFSEALLMVK